MVGGNLPKDAAKLEEHAASLWQYLDVQQDSTIRMFMNWQSAGGLSFMAAGHRRGMQCFKSFGNKHNASCKSTTAAVLKTLGLETFLPGSNNTNGGAVLKAMRA